MSIPVPLTGLLQLENNIFVKTQFQFVKVPLEDILFLEADNNYVLLHTAERKHVVRLTLGQLLDKIYCPKLVRIHRSYAVNIDRMHSFSDSEVCIGDRVMPMGSRYREEFFQQFR